MINGSWGAGAGALSTMAVGCAIVAGIDKDYHPLGDGGAGMGGTLGDACPEVGALACAGNAQRSKLICGPDKKWAANGTCDGDTLCDTMAGVDQGRANRWFRRVPARTRPTWFATGRSG